jgi:hypothetical protein
LVDVEINASCSGCPEEDGERKKKKGTSKFLFLSSLLGLLRSREKAKTKTRRERTRKRRSRLKAKGSTKVNQERGGRAGQ